MPQTAMQVGAAIVLAVTTALIASTPETAMPEVVEAPTGLEPQEYAA